MIYRALFAFNEFIYLFKMFVVFLLKFCEELICLQKQISNISVNTNLIQSAQLYLEHPIHRLGDYLI